MHRFKHMLQRWCPLGVLLVACSGSTDRSDQGDASSSSGGTMGAGGNPGSGGAGAAAGGSANGNTGGHVGAAGGASSSGGVTRDAGSGDAGANDASADATTGADAARDARDADAEDSAGGMSSSGGASSGGGAAGASSGGATATGGATGSGGSKATGGTTGSGGATATGGATGSGGSKATGGTTGSGGAAATGGTTGSGGAPSIGDDVVYLNWCDNGSCHYSPGDTDSVANTADYLAKEATLSAASLNATNRAAVVSCLNAIFAGFHIVITESEPSAGAYREVALGGTSQQAGFGAGVGLAATMTCGVSDDNAVIMAFANTAGANDVASVCWLAAKGVGNSYGIDNAYSSTDVMTYLSTAGARRFRDMDVPCGEYSARDCCTGAKTENTYQLLMAAAGH